MGGWPSERGASSVRARRPAPRRASAAALLLLAAVAGRPAVAQPRDPAAAEELFRAGLTALDQGDWAGACAKFDASIRLDPSAGTSINVARCHEHAGRLAAAWAELERARVLAREAPEQRRREVEAFVDAELRRIEPRIPRLRIAAASLPPGAAIWRDGIPLADGALGVALPIDPGAHVVEASAPGHRPGRWTVTLAEGATSDVAVQLEPIPGGAFTPPSEAFDGPGTAPPRDGGPAPAVVLGVVLTGVGAAGLAVGAVGGLGALDAKGDIEDLGCDQDTLRCPSEQVRARAQAAADRGGTMAAVSTIGFVGGGLLAAAGVTLLIVDAARDRPRVGGPAVETLALGPVVSPAGAGLGLHGVMW